MTVPHEDRRGLSGEDRRGHEDRRWDQPPERGIGSVASRQAHGLGL